MAGSTKRPCGCAHVVSRESMAGYLDRDVVDQRGCDSVDFGET
jgi:hypothetical protein